MTYANIYSAGVPYDYTIVDPATGTASYKIDMSGSAVIRVDAGDMVFVTVESDHIGGFSVGDATEINTYIDIEEI
jgi:hypothetical protein